MIPLESEERHDGLSGIPSPLITIPSSPILSHPPRLNKQHPQPEHERPHHRHHQSTKNLLPAQTRSPAALRPRMVDQKRHKQRLHRSQRRVRGDTLLDGVGAIRQREEEWHGRGDSPGADPLHEQGGESCVGDGGGSGGGGVVKEKLDGGVVRMEEHAVREEGVEAGFEEHGGADDGAGGGWVDFEGGGAGSRVVGFVGHFLRLILRVGTSVRGRKQSNFHFGYSGVIHASSLLKRVSKPLSDRAC